MFFIKNKVALVTGGASGIGKFIAKELLQEGAKGITIADVDGENGEKAAEDLAKKFGPNRVLFVKTDVSQRDEIEEVFKATIATFNNLDIVVNAAGILNDKIWEKEIEVNLKGTIYSCLFAFDEYLPAYKSGSEAVIVNVSSVASFGANDPVPVYTATKCGVLGLSQAMGTERHYKRTKVRVLTICPSATETPLMTEISGRFLGPSYEKILDELLQKYSYQQPEDVAKGVVKIIEDGSNGSVWITHQGRTFEVKMPELSELLAN